MLRDLYGTSLALLTDLYQLTMAYGYWKTGMAEHHAVFDLHFRRHPFKGGYTVACGLESAVDLAEGFGFEPDDLDYLSELRGNDERPLFEPGFLDYLGELQFTCDVDGIPEGTPVFPHEPLVRMRGPILQCQILETPLLNVINFQTLIATKASRICRAARGEPVIDFGLRRAQGIDGGLTASRAAFVGGCIGTSNVLAGKLLGIPVKGTHAHSWIMAFDSELEAFEAYARAMPNNCIFLVDTYDTLDGVRNAVRVAEQLRRRGHEMVGIRLDSGDLAELSIQARAILDEGGFPNAAIVASSDLDEHRIGALEERGAQIGVWGVGTRLVTAHDQPALGGVYKLTAIRPSAEAGVAWEYRVKLSDTPIKNSNPGIHQVRRYWAEHGPLADVIYDVELGIGDGCRLTDVEDFERGQQIPPGTDFTDLLVPVFEAGRRVYEPPALEAIRARSLAEVDRFGDAVCRIRDPAVYPVGLEGRLADLKRRMMIEAGATF